MNNKTFIEGVVAGLGLAAALLKVTDKLMTK